MSGPPYRTFEERPPILLSPEAIEGMFTLAAYEERAHGYAGLRKVLKEMQPADVVSQVKESGLRGRGGAGFPAGTKWSFIPKESKKPVYLVCNADEGEPGTFKDRWLLRHNPHQLIEGILIAAYAVGCHHAFVYMRDEFSREAVRFRACLEEARAAGYIGTDIMGSGFACRITLFMGAGAYICGEETALLSSLEGKRGYPRVRPPFPAIEGLYASPTVVNNVETLSNLPHIARNGGAWYAAYGTKQSTGTRLFSISGRVKRPGVYEIEMGTPWTELIEGLAGGPSREHAVKAVFPGGSSTPILTTAEVADATIDFESAMNLSTFLGSGGTIVLDEGDDMVDVALNVSQFYMHETCGQCTPCREGCRWMVQIIRKIAEGVGTTDDIDLLLHVAGQIKGNTICAFGDGAADPIAATVRKFRDDFEARVEGRGRAGVDAAVGSRA